MPARQRGGVKKLAPSATECDPPPLGVSRGRTGVAAYLMASRWQRYSVLSIASALETAYSPGFSTLSASTTPFSTSIA